MPQARRMTRSRAAAAAKAPRKGARAAAKGAAAGKIGRRATRRSSAPVPPPTRGGRRKAKGTPKTPRDPPPLPALEADDGNDTEDMLDDDDGGAAVDDDDDSDAEDSGLSPLESLPRHIRSDIFSLVSDDAFQLAKYRVVCKMFAEFADLAVRRLAISPRMRVAMFRHHMNGNDPSKLLWDVVGRFAESAPASPVALPTVVPTSRCAVLQRWCTWTLPTRPTWTICSASRSSLCCAPST